MGNIKYFLCYNTPLGLLSNGTIHYRIGKQEISNPYDKNEAIYVANFMNDIYGSDTHWIEDETGERINED